MIRETNTEKTAYKRSDVLGHVNSVIVALDADVLYGQNCAITEIRRSKMAARGPRGIMMN